MLGGGGHIEQRFWFGLASANAFVAIDGCEMALWCCVVDFSDCERFTVRMIRAMRLFYVRYLRDIYRF